MGATASQITSLTITGLCAGNSPVTGEFPAQMASNTENVSIWWRHHAIAGYFGSLRHQGICSSDTDYVR